MMQNKKFGLVLSGGGYRGAAHIGVLKAMEERGIVADFISGTSAGAMVGALHAAGYHWSEVLSVFEELEVFSFRNYALNKPGMIDSDKFYEALNKLFPEDRFEALTTPLFVSATDIIEAKTRFFHSRELIRPLLASMAVPGVFSPVEIEGNLLCDGGVTNNFPTEPLLSLADALIGVYVNPLEKITKDKLKTGLAVVQRAYFVIRAVTSQQKFSDCDILVAPSGLNHYGVLSKGDTHASFELGYTEGVKQIDQFLSKE